MRVYAVSACLLLASCAAKPAPVPAPPDPEPPPILVPFKLEAKPEPAKPVVTETITKEYQKAAKKEIPAIVAPDATPESVHNVRTADVDARRALSHLESQGHHPTQSALDAARAAVKRLSDVLSSSGE